MLTFTNEISASAFFQRAGFPAAGSVAGSELSFPDFSTQEADVQSDTTPTVEIRGHSTHFEITDVRETTLAVFSIPADADIAGWHLKSLILAYLQGHKGEWVAATWLEGIAEYGVGADDRDAIEDLVMSLGEYRECLEARKGRLGGTAQQELSTLQRVIERR